MSHFVNPLIPSWAPSKCFPKPEPETRGVKVMCKFEIRGKGIIGKIKNILEVWVGNPRRGQGACPSVLSYPFSDSLPLKQVLLFFLCHFP